MPQAVIRAGQHSRNQQASSPNCRHKVCSDHPPALNLNSHGDGCGLDTHCAWVPQHLEQHE